jgi:hypothetical protein
LQQLTKNSKDRNIATLIALTLHSSSNQGEIDEPQQHPIPEYMHFNQHPIAIRIILGVGSERTSKPDLEQVS